MSIFNKSISGFLMIFSTHIAYAATLMEAPCVTPTTNTVSNPTTYSGRWELHSRLLGNLSANSIKNFSTYTSISAPYEQTFTLFNNADINSTSAVQSTCTGYPVIGSFINTWATSGVAGDGGPNVTFDKEWAFNTGPNLGAMFSQNPGQKMAVQFWGKLPNYLIGLTKPSNPVACELSLTFKVHHLDKTGVPDRAMEILFNVFTSRSDHLNYAPRLQYLNPILFSAPLNNNNENLYSAYSNTQQTGVWNDLRLFRAQISEAQMKQILSFLGEPMSQYSNLYNYKISAFGVLHEVPNHIDGENEMSCGATIVAPGIYML